MVQAALGLLLFTFVIFLRDLGRLLQVVVESSSGRIFEAMGDLLPTALVFALPMAVLVGILIGLSRMAADNEVLALRASGLSNGQLLRPLAVFIGFAWLLALVTGLWIAPAANRQFLRLESELRNSQIAFAVQPRIFIETIPKLVVYVGDTREGGKLWRKVFVADMHQPGPPNITVARAGRLVRNGPQALQLHLEHGASYQLSRRNPNELLVSSFVSSDVPLLLPPPRMPHLPWAAQPTSTLLALFHNARQWRPARIEFYRRLALAFACLMLPLVGVPLGLSTRKGGKAGGVVLTLVLVLVYYILLISGVALAHQGRMPPGLGVWFANLVFLAAGALLLARAGHIPRVLARRFQPAARFRHWLDRFRFGVPAAGGARRLRFFPSLLDYSVLREFVGYVLLALASFLVIITVFTFFELLGSIIHTHASLALVGRYLFYLIPQLLYLSIPLAVLIGVLLVCGLMSKANEITALKACGIGIHRLLYPLLMLAMLLAVGQFVLQETILPGANQLQNSLRARLKGQPAETFRRPGQRWLFGRGHHLYYFRYYDPTHRTFADLAVYSFTTHNFALSRMIQAHGAYWDARLHGWVLEDGWVREFQGDRVTNFQNFRVASFRSMRETPAYFQTQAPEASQMTFLQLRQYIDRLARSGYDVNGLLVELNRKLAFPLITVIMVLLAFPFALAVGRRGAVGGIALAFAVAMGYWISAGLLQALGNLDQLPPVVAAWSPDVLFAAAGILLLLRLPT